MQAFVRRTMAKVKLHPKPKISRDACIAANMPSMILYALAHVLHQQKVSIDMLTDENAQDIQDWITLNTVEDD
jgi:hypothetical protein